MTTAKTAVCRTKETGGDSGRRVEVTTPSDDTRRRGSADSNGVYVTAHQSALRYGAPADSVTTTAIIGASPAAAGHGTSPPPPEKSFSAHGVFNTATGAAIAVAVSAAGFAAPLAKRVRKFFSDRRHTLPPTSRTPAAVAGAVSAKRTTACPKCETTRATPRTTRRRTTTTTSTTTTTTTTTAPSTEERMPPIRVINYGTNQIPLCTGQASPAYLNAACCGTNPPRVFDIRLPKKRKWLTLRSCTNASICRVTKHVTARL